MTSKAQRRKNRKKRFHKGGMPRKTKITLAPDLPLNGDHGPGTLAATVGTILEPIEDDPNRRGRRRRVEVISTITSLTMRQKQAAQAIRDAYCKHEMLSSGSPLKERVQASPKPDATIAVQIDAMSRLKRVMDAIPQRQRKLVEHICWHNQPGRTSGYVRWQSLFASTMDGVADALGY